VKAVISLVAFSFRRKTRMPGTENGELGAESSC
jgi:hypothetical protein